MQQGLLRNRGRVAGQHDRPTHRSGRQTGRLGDGVDHQPLQRALSQLTEDQADQKILHGTVGLAQQRRQ